MAVTTVMKVIRAGTEVPTAIAATTGVAGITFG